MIKHKSALHREDIVYSIVFLILFFQMALQDWVPILAYFDEAFTIALTGMCLVKLIVQRRRIAMLICDQWTIFLLVLLAFIGVSGNICWRYQTNLFYIMTDMLACTRFAMVYIALNILVEDSRRILRIISLTALFWAIILFSCAIVNLLFETCMRFETRYGIPVFKFVFAHPTMVVWISCGCIAVMTCNYNRNKLYIAMLLFVICFTLRFKGIGFVVAYLYIVIVMKRIKNHAVNAALIGASALFVAWNQVKYYYGNPAFARAALQIYSVRIAHRFFPLGAGFASFASNMANVHYSPLYYEYNMQTIVGCTPDDPCYMSDTFVPIVLGQFGWIGLALFAAVIVFILRSIWVRTHKNEWVFRSCLSIMVYMMISTTSESAFYHPMAVYLFFILGLLVKSVGDPGMRESIH